MEWMDHHILVTLCFIMQLALYWGMSSEKSDYSQA